MTRRLRITVVCGHSIVGGAERWLLGLLDRSDRFEVEAVVLQDGPLAGEFAVRGIPLTTVPTGARPVDVLRSAGRLARELRRRQPDLVLANGVKAAFAAAPAARLTGYRSVWVRHDHTFEGPAARLLGRLVDGVVATSATLARSTGRDDAVIIEPPLPDVPLLDRAESRRALGLPEDGSPVLLVAGRLVPYKGVDDAVAALAHPGGRSWRLAVLGGCDPSAPDERDRLEALARRLGVAERVHLLGDRADAASLMAGADAVGVLTKPVADARPALLPRVPTAGGFGMVALEAMRAGRPVVATGPGPVAERVTAAGCGIVLPAGDPAEIAAALGRLDAAGYRTELGDRGRTAVAGHADAATTADQLARALAQVAARPGAGRSGGPPVSVVTTVLNEVREMAELLDVLVPQLSDTDEIVVVDGGSDDGTQDVVARREADDSRVRLQVLPGAGISAGRNAGIRAARHEWVALTDVGCRPREDWLEAFRAAAADCDGGRAGDRGVGMITGVYTATPNAASPGRWGAALAQAFAVLYPDVRELRRPTLLVRSYTRLLGQAFDASLPTGRSTAVRRDAWAAAGGFPEDLPVGEDVVFGRRVVQAGVEAVLCADADVVWRQRPTASATVRMYRGYGRGDGASGDRLLVGRDVARVAAYALGPVGLSRRGLVRWLTIVGAAFYWSLPLNRLARRAGFAGSAAALPFATALRDAAKAVGAMEGTWSRRRGQP